MVTRQPSCTSTHSNAGATNTEGGPDIACTVFSWAPFWCYAQIWHCKHPDSTSESSKVQFIGPFTGEELLRHYRERQMKGSNLVVGLTTNTVPAAEVPAAFFRTLAYIFEVAKTGGEYLPVSEANLKQGQPSTEWCRPLWTITDSKDMQKPGQEQDTNTQPLREDDASSLFHTAPFWCYLYSHEPSRAKKTPPKTSEQMLSIHQAGSLPDWTPVLGLAEDVSKYNSLPPSLFMPLGMLLHLTRCGVQLKALSIEELQRFDKFIGTRSAAGTTQGGLLTNPVRWEQSSSISSSNLSAGPLHPQASGSLASSTSSWGYPPGSGTSYIPYQASSMYPYMMAPMTPSLYYAGHYGSVYQQPGAYMQGNNGASAGGNHADKRRNGSKQQRKGFNAGGSSHEAKAAGQGPAAGPAAADRAAPSMARAGSQPRTSAATAASCPPPANRWQTPLFQLFTADAARGNSEAAWWYLFEGPPAFPLGPFCPEAMIMAFASGSLSDQHMVCGTIAEPWQTAPPQHRFEKIGALLSMIEQGGHYLLYRRPDSTDHEGPGYAKGRRAHAHSQHAGISSSGGKPPAADKGVGAAAGEVQTTSPSKGRDLCKSDSNNEHNAPAATLLP